MYIAITGGTGLVGTALTDYFINKGHTVYIFTRSQRQSSKKNLHYIPWLTTDSSSSAAIKQIDVFINLAGESINSGRWTESRKSRIKQSRLMATDTVINYIKELNPKPSLLINASAIGIYGTSETKSFDETSVEYGDDFLAKTVISWEEHAKKAEEFNVKVAYARFGIILAENGGALPKMLLPYQLMIGGKIGSGKQWLSWIHIDDVVESIDFIISEQLSGVFNLTAPKPVTMNEFGQTIGKVLKKTHWLAVPSIALRILLGEMSILILEGQKVLPNRLLSNGYTFKYQTLAPALQSIVSEKNSLK
ncbi:TIGR01777 family oxidoreductase [Litchfieldia alkalitelluris]|uniref:TIGR01777 family oxidoreductase n=1 Tax=Litchfieldia alkalitelluris TaxID=304268 RepID=UPI000997DA68|nr:TIGR01777 family oxidoreductase [Litchfieldia alkalitelluris]